MDKLKEEEGQRELFDASDILRISPEDYAEAKQALYNMGSTAADKATDLIGDKVMQILQYKARAMHIDLEAEAAEADMDIVDYVMELDEYFEIFDMLADAYVNGMNNCWPHEIN